jgi:hypothetical protein
MRCDAMWEAKPEERKAVRQKAKWAARTEVILAGALFVTRAACWRGRIRAGWLKMIKFPAETEVRSRPKPRIPNEGASLGQPISR